MTQNMDRLKDALARIIDELIGRRLDYLARYPCTVIMQEGADGRDPGTLHLRPDDDRIAGLTGVPIRSGAPGVSVQVAPGARVLLAFEQGDPAKPVAELWESGTPITLTIKASALVSVQAPAVSIESAAVTVSGALAAASISAAGMSASPSGMSVSSSSVALAAASGDAQLDASHPLSKVKLGAGGHPVARLGDGVSFVAVCPYNGLPHIPGAIAAGSSKVESE